MTPVMKSKGRHLVGEETGLNTHATWVGHARCFGGPTGLQAPSNDFNQKNGGRVKPDGVMALLVFTDRVQRLSRNLEANSSRAELKILKTESHEFIDVYV